MKICWHTSASEDMENPLCSEKRGGGSGCGRERETVWGRTVKQRTVKGDCQSLDLKVLKKDLPILASDTDLKLMLCVGYFMDCVFGTKDFWANLWDLFHIDVTFGSMLSAVCLICLLLHNNINPKVCVCLCMHAWMSVCDKHQIILISPSCRHYRQPDSSSSSRPPDSTPQAATRSNRAQCRSENVHTLTSTHTCTNQVPLWKSAILSYWLLQLHQPATSNTA